MKVLAICGSIRKDSFTRVLLNHAIDVAPKSIQIKLTDLSLIPLYNQDIDNKQLMPSAVVRFRDELADSDAILFGVCEYNYSISGVLKNAIDWASRTSVGPSPIVGKKSGMIGGGGMMGSGRAQYHLRQIGVFLDLKFLNKPEIFVQYFSPPKKFENGALIDETTRKFIKEYMEEYANFVNQ